MNTQEVQGLQLVKSISFIQIKYLPMTRRYLRNTYPWQVAISEIPTHDTSLAPEYLNMTRRYFHSERS